MAIFVVCIVVVRYWGRLIGGYTVWQWVGFPAVGRWSWRFEFEVFFFLGGWGRGSRNVR